MPRNSIRNLGAAGATPPAPQPENPPLPEELEALLQERAVLERQMQALTGSAPTDAADARHRRYPITPMRARRADDADWMARRDQRAGRQTGSGDRAPDPSTAMSDPASRIPRRDRRVERAVGSVPADRTAQIRAVGRDLRALRDMVEAPPERTGQRGMQEPPIPERTSLRQVAEAGRQVSSLSDGGNRFRDVERFRDLDRPRDRATDQPLDLRPLSNDPALRDLTPRIPVPEAPRLRSLDDRLSGARKRLDILQGGSGNLDRLRDVARQRLIDRRRETDRDAKRDAARLDRRSTGRPQE